MLVTLLKSKLHRACVTESNLDYEGSIFIDDRLLKKAGIIAYEKVEIYNINNGQRFATYAVPVQKQGYMCVNGAAARLVQTGDIIIVCAYASFTPEDATQHQPTILVLDATPENTILKIKP